MVEDAKGLYAYHRVHGEGVRDSTGYLMEAVQGVAANKTRFAQAQARRRKTTELFGNLPRTSIDTGEGLEWEI